MNYLKKLPDVLKKLQVTPGQVSVMEVKHDSWCDLLNGRGPCNCEPDITIKGMAGKN